MDEQKTRPSAIVRDDLPTEQVAISEASVAELLTVCIARAADERRGAASVRESEAAREFSIAITHMEDAITRFNKGVYRVKNTFAISDAERS